MKGKQMEANKHFKRDIAIVICFIIAFCIGVYIYHQPALRYRDELYLLSSQKDTEQVFTVNKNSIRLTNYKQNTLIEIDYKWYGKIPFYIDEDETITVFNGQGMALLSGIWKKNQLFDIAGNPDTTFIELLENNHYEPNAAEALQLYEAAKTAKRGTSRTPMMLFICVFGASYIQERLNIWWVWSPLTKWVTGIDYRKKYPAGYMAETMFQYKKTKEKTPEYKKVMRVIAAIWISCGVGCVFWGRL